MAFKISMKSTDFEKTQDPDTWPYRVGIRIFKHFNSKKTQQRFFHNDRKQVSNSKHPLKRGNIIGIKISMKPTDFEKAQYPDTWPYRVGIRLFKHFNSKKTQQRFFQNDRKQVSNSKYPLKRDNSIGIKISMKSTDFEKAQDPDTWPYRVGIRLFNHFNSKKTQQRFFQNDRKRVSNSKYPLKRGNSIGI